MISVVIVIETICDTLLASLFLRTRQPLGGTSFLAFIVRWQEKEVEREHCGIMQAEGTDNDKGGKLLVQREPSCLLDDVIVHALNRLNLLHAWIS